MPETYTVPEAAAYLKLHPETVREMIRQGRITAAKIGRRFVIQKQHLDALLASSENETMQALSERRSKQKCPSINAITSGTSISRRKAAAELDSLLALKTSRKPKGCTTN